MAGKLVGIVGPSGVGKTTIISALVNRKKGIGEKFERILNLTTRPRRWYEVSGRDYLFVSERQMLTMLAADPTLRDSMVQINGIFFTVSHQEIADLINSGSVGLLEMYITKVPEFKERYGDDFMTLYFFPPSIDVLAQRLRNNRLHDETFVVKRMIQTAKELDLACGQMNAFFDAFIELNPELAIAVRRVEQAITRLVLTKRGRLKGRATSL